MTKGVPRTGAPGRPLISAAADEMNHLELVAVVEGGFYPPVAGDDFAVEFDGDAVGFDA